MAKKSEKSKAAAALVGARWRRTTKDERKEIMRDVAVKGWATRKKALKKKSRSPK